MTPSNLFNSISLLFSIALISACSTAPKPEVLGYGKDTFSVGEKLYSTDFSNTNEWVFQVEEKDSPEKEIIEFKDGMLDLYMPARGCTAWLTQKFEGPIMVEYKVKCPLETINGDSIQARDINNFWHCSGVKNETDIFNGELFNGGFGSYGKMQGYYASTGGGGHIGNKTTRFRRYPREVDGKPYPHIALNDRDGQEGYLITPGEWHTVQLVIFNGTAQYIMDGKVFYEIKAGDTVTVETVVDGKRTVIEEIYNEDTFPSYNEGYFGFRLVRTHHQYKDLNIYRLNPVSAK
ncbi:DUF6250 domain-containing protein [Pontiellaceae bacterium B12219]|nr:DUF6250 domain-containing protein [Pontiellaceae bacterium B12219]